MKHFEIVALLFFVPCTLMSHAALLDTEYRKGPAVSFGVGSNTFLISEDVSVSLPTAAVELGYGFSENLFLCADLNAILPKIGVGCRYFIPQFNEYQTFANFGFGKLAGVSYWIVTGGVGYQWSSWGTSEISLSYNKFSLGELFGEPLEPSALSVSVMARAILW